MYPDFSAQRRYVGRARGRRTWQIRRTPPTSLSEDSPCGARAACRTRPTAFARQINLARGTASSSTRAGRATRRAARRGLVELIPAVIGELPERARGGLLGTAGALGRPQAELWRVRVESCGVEDWSPIAPSVGPVSRRHALPWKSATPDRP